MVWWAYIVRARAGLCFLAWRRALYLSTCQLRRQLKQCFCRTPRFVTIFSQCFFCLFPRDAVEYKLNAISREDNTVVQYDKNPVVFYQRGHKWTQPLHHNETNLLRLGSGTKICLIHSYSPAARIITTIPNVDYSGSLVEGTNELKQLWWQENKRRTRVIKVLW